MIDIVKTIDKYQSYKRQNIAPNLSIEWLVFNHISFPQHFAMTKEKMRKREKEVYHNPLTAGFDIETGGHVFQLVFSNSQAMNDVAYFTNATGKWNGGSIYFGFNMYRVF